VWHLDHPPEEVYDVLEEVREYPLWWPEIKRVEQLAEDRARATCRAILPYTLVMDLHQERRDRDAGVLIARLTGDLDGHSRWTISPSGNGGTDAVFDEEVVARKPLLRRLALVARPLFQANHAVMMYRGQRGLRRHVAQRSSRGNTL
jgi:hypothetical protein